MIDKRIVLREFMAEMLGTFLLLSLGFSAILTKHIYPPNAVLKYKDCTVNGTDCEEANQPALKIEVENIFILIIAFAFGSGIIGAVLVAGHISGAHLNPGVTITFAALSKIPWIKVAYYLPAQYLGGFLSAAAVHLFHLPHTINEKGVDTELLKSVFVTSPHIKINIWIAMLDGMLSGFLLIIILMAISDFNANGVPTTFHSVYVFICFIGILIAFLANAGAALNPARDLGPKLYVALFCGFKDVFDDFSYCFWWLPQQICITLGFYLGGLTYYTVFEQISPPTQV